MNEKNLIKEVKDIYVSAIDIENDKINYKQTKYAISLLDQENDLRQIRLKKMNVLPEIKEEHSTLYNKERKIYELIIEKINLNKNTNNQNTINYINAVKEYSEKGNSGFYDIGSIVSIKSEETEIEFKKRLKELQDSGLDIKILKEERFLSETQNVRINLAIIMASSAYSKYEYMMETNFKERSFKSKSELLRSNYFIPPFIESRNSIDDYNRMIIKRESVNRYVFSGLGYSTVELDTKGGYGLLNKSEDAMSLINSDKSPIFRALFESIELSLSNISIYEKRNDIHSNYMMPTLLCYGKQEKLNRSLDVGEKHRMTIENGLKGYEFENKKQENKKRTKYKN